ncbi:MAG TPA: hypothetical protein VIC57_20510 [Candidatus Dormibacteraeota bacterium]|jgi:hypothetical protein
MEWIVGAIVVAIALCLWALNWWLNVSPPASQLSCRTCRQLQRKIQWLKLGLVGAVVAGVALPVVLMSRMR